MGLRRLTDKERKVTRAMAGAMLGAEEHTDVVRAAVRRYLFERGWDEDQAGQRAREIVEAQIAWSAPEEDT